MQLFILSLFLLSDLSFALNLQLKDGTKIDGELEGIMEDVYMIRTKYGLLSVKKEEIINQADLEKKEIPDLTSVSTTAVNSSSETISLEPEETESFRFETVEDSSGSKKIYYQGQIAIATITHGANGEIVKKEGEIKDGNYFNFSANGALKAQIKFSQGLQNGTAKFFYENGNLQIKADYAQGLLEGTMYTYSLEGKLLSEQNYSAGKLNGVFSEYNMDGSLKSKINYINGEAEKEKPQQEKTEIIEENPLSAKKIKLARGYKYLVYVEKKYKTSFTLDFEGNLISAPAFNKEGHLKLYDEFDKLSEEFYFFDGKINKYIKHNKNQTESFFYDEKGRALKKKN